ncbi:MAG: FmdB family zinc ribbon protein [Thermoleophilia bacterium]
MPIYQYRCVNGHEFEVMQRMSDDALDTCEVCGAAASRVLFAPAIHFKGSGFHNTDYGTRRRPVSEDGGGSGSGGGDGASSNGGGTSGSTPAKSSDSGGSGGGKSVGLDKV